MRLFCLLSLAASVSGGFIDQDTPLDKRTTTSFVDGTEYQLVSYMHAFGTQKILWLYPKSPHTLKYHSHTLSFSRTIVFLLKPMPLWILFGLTGHV